MKVNNLNRKSLEKICRIFGFFNEFIPKEEKKILIYNSTPSYQNNYAMYNYLIQNEYNQDYRIYYYMPEIKKYDKNVKNVTLNYTLIGALYHYLTSKYVFLDTGNIRIKPSKKQLVMNLWHGIPFKRIGFLSKSLDKNLPKDLMNTFTKIVVPTDKMKKIYMDSFNLEENQIYFSGQPRNDLLKEQNNIFKKININKEKYTKIVMWMTTYRISKDERLYHTSDEDWSETNLPLIINNKKIEELNLVLKKHNILLIIKHHTTGKETGAEIKETGNIRILKEDEYLEKNIQLYEILGNCDALITDYSSVFTDFLLLNRPIGFIISDIKDYDNKNGFSLNNPKEFMPGVFLNKVEELDKFFESLIEEKDEYEVERLKICKFFNQYEKMNNCKNILEWMHIEKEN